MWKIRIFTIVTIILGLISLGWIIYDYFALTDLAYNYGADALLIEKRRLVTLGFIPIVLFHISFFALAYMLFGFLKNQRSLMTETAKLKAAQEVKPVQDKAGPVKSQPSPGTK